MLRIRERKEVIGLINKAIESGARQARACDIIGMNAKTFQRWHQSDHLEDGRLHARHEPANKLTELERLRLLRIANAPEYAELPPIRLGPG